MLTLFEFEFKLFFHLQGVLTENYEFANMKTEREFNKTMMNLYAFFFEMRIGFLFLERGMKNVVSKNSKRKILDYAK